MFCETHTDWRCKDLGLEELTFDVKVLDSFYQSIGGGIKDLEKLLFCLFNFL
jgi:hypothetical protein